jgi:hypothetical protein
LSPRRKENLRNTNQDNEIAVGDSNRYLISKQYYILLDMILGITTRATWSFLEERESLGEPVLLMH